MKYYIKKLGHQEMGSIGADGRPQRGRYLLISKDLEILQEFPPLSERVLNDSSIIPIIPLYQGSRRKIYCNFVYHNDKICCNKPNGRNEYRLYCNQELEGEPLYFKENDIVVFRKNNEMTKDIEENIYYMECVKDINSELYKYLDNIIANTSNRGAHAIYEGCIEVIENKITRKTSIKEQEETFIDEKVSDRIKKENIDDMSNLFNASSFHDFIMAGYENKCAITRTVIRHANFMNLEAAHIKPRSHGGKYLPSNGIALSRDLHWAFDKGFFTLDDNLCVLVHDDIKSEYLRQFNHKSIFIPKHDFFVPKLENIKYHQENVFGLFKTSGRL